MVYNMDQDRRDSLIPFKNDRWNAGYLGGIRRYEGLDVEVLGQLINEGFVDLEERQNNAPTIRRFYNFMKRYPEFKAHGYVVDKEREDYRLSVEGVEGKALSDDAIKAFRNISRGADDRSVEAITGACYNWWD
jgi:hypothetical protein